MNRYRRAALAAAMAISVPTAQAADGAVDTSFGDNGVARVGLTDSSGGSVGCLPLIQPDGKILMCGTRVENGTSGSDFFVARFLPDGTLDEDFSFDGIATVDFDDGNGTDSVAGIALQDDGRIVIVGTTAQPSVPADFAIARLTTDGLLDATFGAGTGKTTVAFDLDGGTGADTATSVALQPDGRIVVAGSATVAGRLQVAATRLLPDGSRDSAFNVNGKVAFGFAMPGGSAEDDAASAVAIDAAGRIVLGVQVSYTDGGAVRQQAFGVARLRANGSLDPDFHANGRTTLAYDPGSGTSEIAAAGMILQQDGRIALMGYADSSASAGDNFDAAVVRFLPDGTPDAGFGSGGIVLVPFDLTANGLDYFVGGVEQSGGRLLLVGTSLGSPVQYATAVRLLPSGAPDPDFGLFGKATYDFGLTVPDGQVFTGIALQGSHAIAGGIAYVPPGGDTTYIDTYLVRLSMDAIFADGFD
jgi:uncharacterized delta-60 repeat protein